MKRQKKLRLSGSLCRVFRLPCVKGAPPQAVRDCFFYNTPTAARFPNPSRRGLQVCFAHSQIPPTAARFPNPSRRGLQACFAHSQIPLHKGAFLSIVLLFDFLSYLLSQKSPPVRRAFCFFILRLLWFLQQAFLREFLRISLKQPHSL